MSLLHYLRRNFRTSISDHLGSDWTFNVNSFFNFSVDGARIAKDYKRLTGFFANLSQFITVLSQTVACNCQLDPIVNVA